MGVGNGIMAASVREGLFYTVPKGKPEPRLATYKGLGGGEHPESQRRDLGPKECNGQTFPPRNMQKESEAQGQTFGPYANPPGQKSDQ